jgi:hypothetical protein
MALFDTLLVARDALEQWLEDDPKDPNDPAKNARRQKVFDAEEKLSQVLRTIEDMQMKAALDELEADAQTLRDAAVRIQDIEGSIEKVESIVADVGAVVGILQKVIGGG